MIAVLTGISTSAQNIMRFDVLAGNVDHTDCLLSLSVDHLNYSTDSLKLALFEIKGKTEAAVPFKMETAGGAKAWFILSGQTLKNTKRPYVFRKTIKSQIFKSGIIAGKRWSFKPEVWRKTNYELPDQTMNPPSGISPLYKRSAFLHPFYSPGGEVLTRIQAPDHYHHFGNWNTWTMTFLGKCEVGFWNLSKGEGTFRFAGLISQVEGPVYTGFKSLQEHIDFGTKVGVQDYYS
ncbi:MAG: PmoA family protein [Draconibacterium sp.]|nr:PmoA family protein [Draconibacterium sp.]